MSERLKTLYEQTIVSNLMDQLDYKNRYQVPRILKIVVNRGLGQAAQNSKFLETSLDELAIISGQSGVLTRSKHAIAAFKLRANVPIGVATVLRSKLMYSFLDRLVNLALPRIRDFQGINPKSFDGSGNYSLGFAEQFMFPEIEYDKVNDIRGMDISIVTTAKTDDESLSLLAAFGMPFRPKSNQK